MKFVSLSEFSRLERVKICIENKNLTKIDLDTISHISKLLKQTIFDKFQLQIESEFKY